MYVDEIVSERSCHGSAVKCPAGSHRRLRRLVQIDSQGVFQPLLFAVLTQEFEPESYSLDRSCIAAYREEVWPGHSRTANLLWFLDQLRVCFSSSPCLFVARLQLLEWKRYPRVLVMRNHLLCVVCQKCEVLSERGMVPGELRMSNILRRIVCFCAGRALRNQCADC